MVNYTNAVVLNVKNRRLRNSGSKIVPSQPLFYVCTHERNSQKVDFFSPLLFNFCQFKCTCDSPICSYENDCHDIEALSIGRMIQI